MKSVIKKRKLIPLLVFLLFGLLNIFNLSSGIAMHMQGEGSTFYPDDDYPTQYGVFIPSPNMYTTMSIQGSNQGEFVMMDWLGGAIDTETVTYPGEDLSLLYPWYFDNYVKETPTSNGYIDPWSVNWMNVTAFNPHNVSLSPYSVNSVFNYYVMPEENPLLLWLNSSIPIQIDILISKIGPKVCKFDWLTDDPSIDLLDDFSLVSPSGKILDVDIRQVDYDSIMGSFELYFYFAFVAAEEGTYRLLIKADYTEPTQLTLEFVDSPVSTLPIETLTFGGHPDDSPTTQDAWDLEWQNMWYEINGEEGDLYRLDLGIDYVDILPIVNFWMPSENGYIGNQLPGAGIYDIIFPMTGSAYISFIDETIVWWNRYSMYLSEFEVLNYTVGNDLTTIKVSGDQRKAIEFEIEQDSFVRFNYTLSSPPFGNPTIYAPGVPFAFLYEDSMNLESFDIISPIETKTVDSETFYYYYLPNGTYYAFIANNDVRYDGIVQISSKLVTWENNPIPINYLTYPETNPSQFITLEFGPDEYYSRLKEGIGIGINITEPGQYRLNITMNLSDYMEVIPPLIDPSAVVFYNFSSDEFTDYTSNATTQYQSFPVVTNDDDELYIAFTSKFQEMHFNFSQLGNNGPGQNLYPSVWHDNSWYSIFTLIDNTNEFEINGTWIVDNSDLDYINWEKGCDFNISGIIEDDFYWLQIYCDDGYGGGGSEIIPFIDLIQLNISGISLEGDINFALVRESGYKYSDYWELTDPTDISLIYYQKIDNLTFSDEQWLFGASSDPYTLGLEEGYYKLLIIPSGWSYEGSLEIQFGIENYWDYRVERTFAISDEPLAYPWQIGNLVNVSDPILYNYSTYPYDFSVSFNDTIVSWDDYTGYYEGYIVLNCFGTAYSWTQLVVEAINITDYELYLVQELPWINGNGPNMEIATIDTGIGANNTIEFGVIRDNFTLLFEYHGDGDENIEFNIGLRQYNTTALYSNEITASYTPPSNPSNGDSLVLTLAIVIPTVAGAAVVIVYVMKKKGRILTKTP